MKVKSEETINMIRSKVLTNTATKEELYDFLTYVIALESLVEEASIKDFYGTKGYKHILGWN